MIRKITVGDINAKLRLATSKTKEVVTAGVNGYDEFPQLFCKYKWSNTRDYNMAVIIVAIIQYCLIQNISVSSNVSNIDTIFEKLREGDGENLKDVMEVPFTNLLDKKILNKAEEDTAKRKKIIDAFLKRVGKISKWSVNKKDVEELIGKISEKEKANQTKEKEQLRKLWSELNNRQKLRVKNESSVPDDIEYFSCPYWYNVFISSSDGIAEFNKWYAPTDDPKSPKLGEKNTVLLFPTKTAYDKRKLLSKYNKEKIYELILNPNNWSEKLQSGADGGLKGHLDLYSNAKIQSIAKYLNKLGID